MKIVTLESLHCDAGTRNFDFLKLMTDTGLVGWSEYNETFGGPGLSAVIERLAPAVIGKDPRAWEAIVTHMYAVRRQAAGGVIQQAIAAIENAMHRPYFENYSVDVAIIDTPWNGVGESIKIANMADTYEINVAPHNFYGPLATMMSAQFCAVVPNLRIMEMDPDTVPWHDDLVTVKPAIKDGHMSLPTGAGWGTEINEAAVRAHPPRPRWGFPGR
jgi:L-alanine-DL-glutamate epimerase-like enolase superfamily enzyme